MEKNININNKDIERIIISSVSTMVSNQVVIVCLVITILAIIVFWILGKKYMYMDDSKMLELDNFTPKFMKRLLIENTKKFTASIEDEPEEIASYILEKTTGRYIEPSKLYIVKDFKTNEDIPNVEIVNMRGIIGMNMKIIIAENDLTIEDIKHFSKISRRIPAQILRMLKEKNLIEPINEYVKYILDLRINKLKQVKPNIENNYDDGFMFTELNIPNIKKTKSNGIDLLCDVPEFNTLLERYKKCSALNITELQKDPLLS